jgi:hypothetical protein
MVLPFLRKRNHAKIGNAVQPARDRTLLPDARANFAKLRQYSISEDGALHAEKYLNTATQEFGRSRAKFRWLHVTALARVTASAGGQPAPGLAETRKLSGCNGIKA